MIGSDNVNSKFLLNISFFFFKKKEGGFLPSVLISLCLLIIIIRAWWGEFYNTHTNIQTCSTDVRSSSSSSNPWDSFTTQPKNITSFSAELYLMQKWWEGNSEPKWSKWRWVRKWCDCGTNGSAAVFPIHDGRPLETFKVQVWFSTVTPALCSLQPSIPWTLKD